MSADEARLYAAALAEAADLLELAVLGPGDALTFAADPAQDGCNETMEVLLLGGRPIGSRSPGPAPS